MKSSMNERADPSVCSCFPHCDSLSVCKKLKWSTLSISIALLIIIVYLSSGLYTLIDVTTIVTRPSSSSSSNYHPDLSLWPLTSSSWMTILGWISVSIYLTVVLLITVLLCGIQLSKPWLLLVWSIAMVVMVLADGIITVLSLREHQQQKYRLIEQVKILFFVMTIRLILSMIGIFVTMFHYRRLSKVLLEGHNRQRMLDLYNAGSPSPSYHESWARPVCLAKEPEENEMLDDLSPPLVLPRAKVSTIAYHPPSSVFQSYKSQSDWAEHVQHRRANDDFRYNIPLQERFHEHQSKAGRDFHS